MQTAIEIKNLSVVLGGKVTAINGMSLELPAGKIIGFIGPSGAGKTTLVRAIVGRQRITGGSVTVFGLPAGSAALRPQMSYMTQEISVYSDLTVTENIEYFAIMAGQSREQTKKLIPELLASVGMADRASYLVRDLSGGQKQRVSLAVAIIGYPKLMVLDEPTVGLDPVLRDRLWELFNKLAKSGTTIIITSHAMDEASRCDDLVLIRDGKLLAHGEPSELCRQAGTKTVEETFIKLVGAKA